jgi:signal transduction histidine kinase
MGIFDLFKNTRLRRLMVLIFFFFLLIVTLLSIFFYRYTMANFEQSELMRLKGIANAVTLSIDGDTHEQLMRQYTTKDAINSLDQDSIYKSLHLILKAHQEANMLKSPIYTLIKSKDGLHYEFGVTSQEKPYFRHGYKSFPVSLVEMYSTGGMLSPYTDDYGSWLSGFNVINNKKGEQVALIMVDEKFSLFTEKTKTQALRALLWAVGLFALMYGILAIILTQILYRENNDKELLKESNSLNEKMKKELQSANSKLIDLDKVRKEMVANLSHDLRTPLSSTIGYIELLRDKQNLSAEDKNLFINIAHSESVKLRDMVSDLFELSKLESGATLLDPEPFIVQELASDVLVKYKQATADKRIQIFTEIEETGLAYGDIRLIDRLFQNLLDNAVRYVQDDGFIKISILNYKDKIKVKVCNQGEPIEESVRSIIFDRYIKVGTKSGTGLGLAIAKKICDLHQCDIQLEVNEDINSFWFTVDKYKGENL